MNRYPSLVRVLAAGLLVAGCGHASEQPGAADGGPDAQALLAAVAGTVVPCDNVVLVGGTRTFDLSPAGMDGVTPTWTASAGTFDTAEGWTVTWTAPGTAATYMVTVTFTFADGSHKVMDFDLKVAATQAEVDAALASCQQAHPSPPPLYTVASHTDPASGLTVILLASATTVPHDGWLLASLDARNDGDHDVTVLDCETQSFHVYLRDASGKTLGTAACGGPTMVCDDHTVRVLHPGESLGEQLGGEVRFGKAESDCGLTRPYMGLSTGDGDGTYQLAAAVDLPPVADHGDVEAPATITVGP